MTIALNYIGGEWVKTGDNETWDGYVAGEVARATLQPERESLMQKWGGPIAKLPVWARPFRPGIDAGIDSKARDRVSPYARMLEVNKRGRGDGSLQRSDRPGTGS